MNKKSWAFRALSFLVASAACILLLSSSDAGATNRSLRYNVVKHTASHVIVQRGNARVVVAKGHRYVKAAGVARYKVTKRTRAYVMLQRLSRSRRANSPTATPTPTPPSQPVITVQPSGGEDQPAIQNAVNTLAAQGGGIVKLVAGTYNLSGGGSVNPDCGANINVRSGVHVQGAGVGLTIVKPKSSGRHPFAASQQTDIGVSDLSIVGNGSGAAQDGVKFYCCDQVTVRNVEASNLYIGLALYGCQDSLVSNCTVHDSSMGIVPSESRLGYQPTRNVRVQNCQVWSCGTGYRPQGYAPGDGGDVVSRVSDVTLIDCTARNCNAGYLVRYAQRVTLVRCTATSSPWTNIWLAGVLDSTLTSSTTPVISTDSGDLSHYGACAGITVN